MTAKALSVRAPWWWFILYGGKDIENRDWPTRFRGTIYLHASKWWRHAEVSDDLSFGLRLMRGAVAPGVPQDIPALTAAGGCIVGKVDIVGCTNRSSSPWFFGDYGFMLARPVAFKRPVPCVGKLGLFTVPDDVLAQLAKAV